MFVGERLKKLRTDKKITQEELGNLINVTKVSICCYERGKRIPSLETLDDLSEVFGVDANYFLGKDIPVVMEDSSEYVYYISKEEFDLIKELRKNKELYKLLTEDSKRTIELLNKKIK
ncbi:MAG TPA: helix-turn-helix transcriptional regulator [Bacilli bacterium]|nr:helix-turn-helix transcriptional regulator [Bacilli bacterium]